MIWLISLVVIGFVVGWLMASLMEGRGGLQPLWSVIVGIIGSFLGGHLFALFGQRLVGEGPAYIVSFIAAAVGAVVLLLLVRLVKR